MSKGAAMREVALLRLAIAVLCLPGLAWARTEPPGFSLRNVYVTATAPEPRGCSPFHPQTLDGIDGTTVLSAHILANGTVSQSRIVSSSGSTDLDRAAVACLGAMHLSPLTRDGLPVEADWRMAVNWPTGRARTAREDSEGDSCGRFYPVSAARAGREGETLAAFVIGADGSVGHVDVIESSGHADLDEATIACVSHFRFHPAMRDGKGVEIDGKFVAVWRR
jgi:TonB family protein